MAEFGWRASIAQIARDGPFSAFAGVDRTLILLNGGPVSLAGPDWRTRLAQGAAPLQFAGDDQVHASPEAPATVLNIMTRRRDWRHRLGGGAGETLLVAREAVSVAGIALAPLDALWLPAGTADQMQIHPQIIRISFEPAP